MAKVHLAATKGLNGKTPIACCAARPAGNGMSKHNSRSTYRNMASKIVPYAEFKNIPAEDRCQHCMERGLLVKNKQRAAKGKPPVAHLFDS